MMLSIILLLASVAFSAPSTAVSTTTDITVLERPETLGEYVRQYYADTPILADIAWCESSMRHLDKDGTIMRGAVNSDDVGVMQVNTRYHEEKAVSMNMDLYTLNGNLAYSKYLYEKEGSKPWASSKACWSKTAKK